MNLIIVDVSGSMELPNEEYSRLKIASMLAIQLSEEPCTVWATAGSDTERRHNTHEIKYRGELLERALARACKDLGGGGAFMDQAVSYIKHYVVKPDNLYIISDSDIEPIPFYRLSFKSFNVTLPMYELFK